LIERDVETNGMSHFAFHAQVFWQLRYQGAAEMSFTMTPRAEGLSNGDGTGRPRRAKVTQTNDLRTFCFCHEHALQFGRLFRAWLLNNNHL